MNLQVLPLSDTETFTHQKCLVPREFFPKNVRPGSLAKCRDSSGTSYICNIYPMRNEKEAKFCWLDDTVQVAPMRKSATSLISLNFLDSEVKFASKVDLTLRMTEKLFEIKAGPSREMLASIAKEMLQPYEFVNESVVHLEELNDLGISEIFVESKERGVFCITSETEVQIKDVYLQNSKQILATSKLIAMETPQRELQQLIQSAAIYETLKWKLMPSLNALIVGPSGCGKTSLCCDFIRKNNCNSHFIRCSDILGQFPGKTEAELRRIFTCVQRFVRCFQPKNPVVIVIEDLDLICPAAKGVSSDSTNSSRISGQLIALLDSLRSPSETSSKTIVLATTSNVEAINGALRRPGRFGIEVNIPALSEQQRGKVFRSMIDDNFFGKSIFLSDELVNSIAKQTQGFTAADLALLVQSICHQMLRTQASSEQFVLALERCLKLSKPASFHGSEVHVYKTCERFNSVGGMDQLKKTLEVSVLAGLRRKQAFKRFGLCLPKGVLLYGPPGCAKTTIAKCLATEANMTFIPTSAAEVYSPFVGNSEKYISKIFDTARKNSPCLVFLDEIDSLVGKRTADSRSDVQTRILSTLLTEMDGIGAKLYSSSPDGNCILVVAATNRPEMIDDALMRPGRFDKLIHVPPPDFHSRMKILELHAKKMPFAKDVVLDVIAKATEGFSGADICNLCNEAAMHAFTQNMDAKHITLADFESVLKHQKSSLTEMQIRSYKDFENTHKK